MHFDSHFRVFSWCHQSLAFNNSRTMNRMDDNLDAVLMACRRRTCERARIVFLCVKNTQSILERFIPSVFFCPSFWIFPSRCTFNRFKILSKEKIKLSSKQMSSGRFMHELGAERYYRNLKSTFNFAGHSRCSFPLVFSTQSLWGTFEMIQWRMCNGLWPIATCLVAHFARLFVIHEPSTERSVPLKDLERLYFLFFVAMMDSRRSFCICRPIHIRVK